ncbi:MAG: hypothetical protein U9N33_01435 [Campylobacterota bacterium]|nr:hypothetical protein [Campylobacterota bacterium]
MKLILILIFSALILSASQNPEHLRVQILEKVLSEISIDTEILIWSDNKEILSEIAQNKHFKTVQNCEDSNIIILEKESKLTHKCADKHIFVLDYQLLQNLSKSFGALFWKKGRPNIIILEPKIKNQSITVSNALEPYLEEKIW